ncbi:LacI family transcriptional regulator [Fictibacillus solisalsi]|uniref:LacI family transcriptional regulator n=1 Tax=Fictibacillus solisalsi TaxID=459525 RepID=A0A1G9YLE4_9BACL|nr:LacI family DNA-binding transcriptional regulator [Fictibacillus solisalsi]SDN09792.1 LacI family transcriptional regulator [Fictibacillus solisalsi]
MKVTLKDIAEEVNLSISTVSRVLNNHANSIPEEMREKIFKISKEMGYKKLNNRKNEKINEKKIGCVINNIKSKYQDPYFSEMIYGVERELIEQGYKMSFSYNDKDLVHLDLKEEYKDDTLGVIVVGALHEDLLKNLSNSVPYVISVGGKPGLDIDYVTVDFKEAAKRATDYLIGLGHEKIACISSSSSALNIPAEEDDRFIGFQEVLASHKLQLKKEWIQDGLFTIEGGYKAMKRILMDKELPTAVFTASDRMAHGAYKAIQEYGLSIPKDISIVSFDNIEMSKYVNPQLSTIHVHKEEMGRIAVKMLLQRMDDSIRFPLTTYLPTELIVRESCEPLT